MDKETPDSPIQLTSKQIGIIFALILALSNGIPIGVNKLSPGVRSDPFTGKEGDKLRKAIERNGESIAGIKDDIEFLELQQGLIIKDDSTCRENLQKLEVQLYNLKRDYGEHKEKEASRINDIIRELYRR